MEQRALVEQAMRGDHDAFADLVRGSIGRLDGAARLMVHDPELARDAVQDALFRAWRDLRRLRDPDSFDAWIYRLTMNACIDLLRVRRRRPVEVEISDVFAPATPDTSGEVADRDLIAAVMRRLEPDTRSVVVLHYFVGMPLADVADTLGIPAGTVKSRLHRALGEMREAMPRLDALAGATAVSGGQA